MFIDDGVVVIFIFVVVIVFVVAVVVAVISFLIVLIGTMIVVDNNLALGTNVSVVAALVTDSAKYLPPLHMLCYK